MGDLNLFAIITDVSCEEKKLMSHWCHTALWSTKTLPKVLACLTFAFLYYSWYSYQGKVFLWAEPIALFSYSRYFIILILPLSRFRLIPESQINFGPLGVFSNKTLHLNIQNIGNFPVKYQVISALLPTTIEQVSKKNKSEKKSTDGSKKPGTTTAKS